MTEEEKIELLPDEAKAKVKALIALKPKDLPENPEKNVWYTYRPQGCLCSDGKAYYSTLKFGTKNKLLIMLCGGGVALDAFSAARPNTIIPEEGKPTFYLADTDVLGYFAGRKRSSQQSERRQSFQRLVGSGGCLRKRGFPYRNE